METERAGGGRDDRSVSLLSFLAGLLNQRRMMAGVALVGIAYVTAYSLLHARTYSSTLTFMPQAGSSSAGGLAGVAAQFGIAVPAASPDMTPQFYAALIATSPFEDDLVSTPFSVVVGRTADGGRDSVETKPMLDWMGVDAERGPAERLAIAGVRLGDVLTVLPDVQTSMVTVTARTTYPDLSMQVAERVLELINRFNIARRGGDAGAERRFVEGRLKLAQDSLSAAEAREKSFLERNRTFQSSPMLSLEHSRLQREVEFNQQVVGTLMQAVEQARISEVRNTPVVTVVEPPRMAGLPDRRRLPLKWVLVLIVTGVVGVVAVLARVGYGVEKQTAPDASDALQAAWSSTLADVARLARPLVWIRMRVARAGK